MAADGARSDREPPVWPLFLGLIPGLEVDSIQIQLLLRALECHACQPTRNEVGLPNRFDAKPHELIQESQRNDTAHIPRLRGSPVALEAIRHPIERMKSALRRFDLTSCGVCVCPIAA